MESLHQICVNSPEYIASIAGYVVMGVSALVNLIPSPDKIENPVGKYASKFLHFVALDIVTSKK